MTLPKEILERIYSFIPIYCHVAIALRIHFEIENNELGWVYIVKYCSDADIARCISKSEQIPLDLLRLYSKIKLLETQWPEHYYSICSSWSVPPRDIAISEYRKIRNRELLAMIYAVHDYIDTTWKYTAYSRSQPLYVAWISCQWIFDLVYGIEKFNVKFASYEILSEYPSRTVLYNIYSETNILENVSFSSLADSFIVYNNEAYIVGNFALDIILKRIPITLKMGYTFTYTMIENNIPMQDFHTIVDLF